MAKQPFTSKTIDITANNPNNTNPSQPPVTLITWTEPVSGGIPLGAAPGATDAPNPQAPNVKRR
jgi:hypothetical protein